MDNFEANKGTSNGLFSTRSLDGTGSSSLKKETGDSFVPIDVEEDGVVPTG
jgi:hypothetical protein